MGKAKSDETLISKDQPESPVNDESNAIEENPLKDAAGQPGRAKLDPRIIAAIIAGVTTLVSGWFLFRATTSPQREIEVAKAKHQIEAKSVQANKVQTAFDAANSSIQVMKDSISSAKTQATYAKANEALQKPSQDLTTAYATHCIDVCGQCSKECSFHKAKEAAKQIAFWVSEQDPAAPVSQDTQNRLDEAREKLDTLQKEVAAKALARQE